MEAGEATWSVSCSWIPNVFPQPCCVRTHRNRKYLCRKSTYHGCTRCGALWRGKGTLSREQTRQGRAVGITFCFILWNLETNLSIILRHNFFFFFPLNDLFPFRERHNHPKIPAFFFFKALQKKTSVLYESRKNLQNTGPKGKNARRQAKRIHNLLSQACF